jgi:hypothetical protein
MGGWKVWLFLSFVVGSFSPANKSAPKSGSVAALPHAFLPRMLSNEVDGWGELAAGYYAGTSLPDHGEE